MVLGHPASSPTLQRPLNEARKFRLPPSRHRLIRSLKYDQDDAIDDLVAHDLGAVDLFQSCEVRPSCMLVQPTASFPKFGSTISFHGTTRRRMRAQPSIRVTAGGINKLEVAVNESDNPSGNRTIVVSDPPPSSRSANAPTSRPFISPTNWQASRMLVTEKRDIGDRLSGNFWRIRWSRNWLSFRPEVFAKQPAWRVTVPTARERVGPTSTGAGREKSNLVLGRRRRPTPSRLSMRRTSAMPILNPACRGNPKDAAAHQCRVAS